MSSALHPRLQNVHKVIVIVRFVLSILLTVCVCMWNYRCKMFQMEPTKKKVKITNSEKNTENSKNFRLLFFSIHKNM